MAVVRGGTVAERLREEKRRATDAFPATWVDAADIGFHETSGVTVISTDSSATKATGTRTAKPPPIPSHSLTDWRR